MSEMSEEVAALTAKVGELIASRDNLLGRNRQLAIAKAALEEEVVQLAAAVISFSKGAVFGPVTNAKAIIALEEWRGMRNKSTGAT